MRRTLGTDHGSPSAVRTVCALPFAEPLEKIEVRVGGHAADATAVRRPFQWAGRPIPWSRCRENLAGVQLVRNVLTHEPGESRGPQKISLSWTPAQRGCPLIFALADNKCTRRRAQPSERL